MKLNKKGREELRKLVEKELENSSDEIKIVLDKKLLDILLFDTIFYKCKPKKIVKLPVWSGEFLRKLDLSQVSFKNVSWALLGEGMDSKTGRQFFDEECWQYFLDNYGKPMSGRVNYSGTNIQVDFNESWEMQLRKEENADTGVEIYGCDFSNNDLSGVDTSNFSEVKASSFANTGLVISESLVNYNFSIFLYTDLTGVSLGNFVINIVDLLTTGGSVIGVGCNLKNTRLSIVLDPKSLKEDKTLQQNFKTILMSGDLNGCYINGKRVLSYEEKAERCAKALAEYERYKEEKFSAVRKAIEKQLEKRK